jgi:hypothetical protein
MLANAGLSLKLRYLALLIPIWLIPMQARADTIAERERAARTACLSGDYAKGVATLAELFVDTKERTYLYNQGRCFEQNGRYEEAIPRFIEYLQKNQDAGVPSDPDTEKHIANCQARLAQQKGQPTAGQPQSAGDTSAGQTPEAPKESGPQPADGVQASVSSEGIGSRLRIAAITTLAVGGAGLVTGLILNIKANSLANELESTRDNYQRSKESTRGTYETFGWVTYSVGAACIAAGTIMYFIGRNQGKEASVSLLPTMGPGAAGAMLQGAF